MDPHRNLPRHEVISNKNTIKSLIFLIILSQQIFIQSFFCIHSNYQDFFFQFLWRLFFSTVLFQSTGCPLVRVQFLHLLTHLVPQKARYLSRSFIQTRNHGEWTWKHDDPKKSNEFVDTKLDPEKAILETLVLMCTRRGVKRASYTECVYKLKNKGEVKGKVYAKWERREGKESGKGTGERLYQRFACCFRTRTKKTGRKLPGSRGERLRKQPTKYES